jgi:hypothetical protein
MEVVFAIFKHLKQSILLRVMNFYQQASCTRAHLAIAKMKDDETVTFGRIKFSDRPVVKWELALDGG